MNEIFLACFGELFPKAMGSNMTLPANFTAGTESSNFLKKLWFNYRKRSRSVTLDHNVGGFAHFIHNSSASLNLECQLLSYALSRKNAEFKNIFANVNKVAYFLLAGGPWDSSF